MTDRHTLTILLSAFLLALPTANAAANNELWSALQEGGKVVLMRHAPVERDSGKGDPLLRDPSCLNERNLSQQGRQDAERLGMQFKQRDIPITEALHSPYCRTTDTARLAFGDARPVEYLSLLEVLGHDEASKRTAMLEEVIAAHSGPGNLVLVTHEPNINAVSFETVRHLDAVVFEPGGGDGYEELGVIRFSEF